MSNRQIVSRADARRDLLKLGLGMIQFLGWAAVVIDLLGWLAIVCCWLAGVHIHWDQLPATFYDFLGGVAAILAARWADHRFFPESASAQ